MAKRKIHQCRCESGAGHCSWWEEEGRWVYNGMGELLILADSGGTNGCRVRLWKHQLQTRLSNRFDLSVVICHYPPGCSKYHPIEHQLFSQISRNRAGQPLRSFELMVGYIAGTTTQHGLRCGPNFCAVTMSKVKRFVRLKCSN